MAKSDFYDIVTMKNVRVSIPKSNHFTVGTSPYHAHQHGLAIDIYQDLSLENYEALSPVSGKVIKTKMLIAPKAKFKDGIDNDYITLISNSRDSEVVYKILHVEPKVQVGEQIGIGDYIGRTIRNGYFAYWSSPHLHLELRPSNDAIRASGGRSFSLAIENKNQIRERAKKNYLKQIPIKIQSVFPEFLLALLPKNFYHKIKPIYGVKGSINRINCILDGGIPHYKNGILIFQQEYNNDSINSIHFLDCKIGTLCELRGQFGLFKFDSVKFFLNNKEIRGISFFLANFLPFVKIIPYKKNEFSFYSKSTQYLSIVNHP